MSPLQRGVGRLTASGLAAGWLVFGVIHLVYHVGHIDGFETVDKVGLIGSLVMVPALAALALWAGRQDR